MSPHEAPFSPTPGALDDVVERLGASAPRWAATPVAQRRALLDAVIAATATAAPAWNRAACAAKGLDPDGPEGGEELFTGIGTFARVATTLSASLRDIERTGRPQYPGPVHHRSGGRLAVGVMPATKLDRALFAGVSAEVWMEPGLDETEVRRTQAAAYRDPLAHQGVSLVLAAGNVASLGPRDALYKLFVEGRVVVLKANPVNEYLVEHWATALAPLIDAGVLAIVHGGADEGRQLIAHPGVTDVHITGSDRTHDAIVFGTGDEGARRKAAATPLMTKPITSELGNVSPVVLVPGDWTAKELRYQAAHVATMLVNNAGFNCLTPRVLVTARSWPQREEFLTLLDEVLASVPTRRAYYPGAADRFATFLAAHPDAHQSGEATEGQLPWTVVRDVDASAHDDVAFQVEAFCSLLSETALDADTTEGFLDRAVAFCNDVLWGTLSMTVLVDPRTARQPAVAGALERAVADLRYGSIGVNIWHGWSFVLGVTTWGAYPGHPVNDIGSGRGVVGNAFMFDRPQKTVVRGPFTVRLAPAWFCTSPNAAEVYARLFDLQIDPSWRLVPALLRAALRTTPKG